MRRIERLLDKADEAISRYDWKAVRQAVLAVLAINPDNADGQTFLVTVDRTLNGTPATPSAPQETRAIPAPSHPGTISEAEGQGSR